MRNYKKFWFVFTVVFLLTTACNSNDKEAENAESKLQNEIENELHDELANQAAMEDKYDDKTGVFESPNGNFSINFPQKPDFNAAPTSFGNGVSITLNTYSYEDKSNTNGYVVMVAYSDLPIGEIGKEEARVFLKNEQYGALGSFGLDKPALEKESDYENYPGLFYKAKIPNGFYIVAQTYMVDGRLYQIVMLANKAYPTEKQIKAFIGTFKLLK